MRKILSFILLGMLCSIGMVKAATVSDLVAISSDYTFIADDITSSGTVKLSANTLYDNGKIFAPTANTVATNKGNSTFAGGQHLNSLRLKNTQDQLAFKVSGPCTVTFYSQSHSSRGIQVGSTVGGTEYGAQTVSTTSWSCDITAAGVVYLSSYNGDFYFAGFTIAFPAGTNPVISTQPISATYSLNEVPSALSVVASPYVEGKALSYQWYSNTTGTADIDNDNLIDGANTNTLAVGNISTTAVGNTYYYCVVSEADGGSSTSSLAKITVVNNRTITFANAEGAVGVVPAAVVVQDGEEIILPKNFTMYKEGYTLTGWTDGENTYLPGASYDVSADKTMTAVYTANTVTLAEHTAAVVINFDFQRDHGAPIVQWEGTNEHLWVAQAVVKGQTIDVPMTINTTSGKFNNAGNTDCSQVNNGTTFSIPSENGAIVEMECHGSYNISTTTINGSTTYEGTGTSKILYNVTSGTTPIEIVIGDGSYYKYVKVTLPGNVASNTYTLIKNDGTMNSTDFYTGATIGGKVTIDEVEYDYAKLGGNASGLNQNALNKYIAYHAKTTYTEIKLKVKNNSTSNRVCNIYGLEEGATEPTVLKTCTLTNKQYLETEYIAYNSAKNRTIYVAVPSSSGDVFFVQVEAKESGDALPMAGDVGYSLNLNKGRLFGPSSKELSWEGMEFYLSSNYSVATNTEAKFSTLGTQYVKFTLPVDTRVNITTSNNAKYFVSQVCSTEDAAKTNETTPTANQATSFDLEAGTWYINPNGSNVQLTNIAFVAQPIKYAVTFDLQGHGDAIDAQNLEAGEKVVEPTAPTASGFAFGGWYKEAGCQNAWDFENDVVTEATVLYAKWTGSYTVSYYDGATLLGTEEVVGGEHPTASGINTAKDFYLFDGWFTNAELIGDAVVLADQTISAPTAFFGKWNTGAVKALEMAWTTNVKTCAEVNPAAVVMSTDDAIAPYLTISLSNVDGGTEGAEGSSLNTGKVAGNEIIIAAKPGYAFSALNFFGKIEDADCEYSIDGGDWTTLSSTNQNGNACYELFEDAEVHVLAIRNTGTSGVWIRNMQVVVKLSASNFAVYQRNVTAGNFGTICLPYAVSANAHQNLVIYSIAGKRVVNETVTSIVLVEEEGALVAGRPYIFEAAGSKAAIIYSEANAATAGNHNGLIGTLSAISVDAPYYLLSNNSIVNAVEGSTLAANRAYFDLGVAMPEYVPSSAPGRIVEIDLGENTTTDINAIEATDKAVKFFENGNLYILREGVVYDATGRVVR